MRKKGGIALGILAYAVGFLTTIFATYGAMWCLTEVAHIAPSQAHLLGIGGWAAILGPVLGIWTARKARAANSADSDH
jgi:hypothetical protein